MKKWPLLFNIVLLVLVGVLFYLHFSEKRIPSPATPTDIRAEQSALRISYVNVDSLEAHYTYFQKKKAAIDEKQQNIQSELASKAKAIQQDIAKLQKDAPTMTQSEGMAAQKKIVGKRKKLQQREQQLRTDFMQQQQQFNKDLHDRLNQFLEKYNADKHYDFIFSYSEALSDILYKNKAYNITEEVISGLNAEVTTAK